MNVFIIFLAVTSAAASTTLQQDGNNYIGRQLARTKRDLIGCKLRVLRGVHDSNFRPDRIKIRIQRDHKVIQDQIEDWKSPPTPLKYNFNDY